MAITIKDVAKVAGASISTVSKVINSSSTISAATKERVQKVMDDLGYYPNIIARSFVQQSTYTIGVLMELKRNDAFINSHHYEILGGIEEVCSRSGYLLTMVNLGASVPAAQSYERMIKQKRVDGLVLHAPALTKSIKNQLEELGVPFIVIGQPLFESNVCRVDINNKMAGELATNHLLDEGYSNIAFLGGSMNGSITVNRLAGYKNALTARELKISKQYIQENAENAEDSCEMMAQLLELSKPPDSVVCTNNYLAFGAIKAIFQKGLRIPEDVAVVSFDNYPLAMYTNPPLTVVDIDVYDLGIHAANALMNKLKNPNLQLQYSMLSPALIIRESTRKEKG